MEPEGEVGDDIRGELWLVSGRGVEENWMEKKAGHTR